jgi:hypothetical protein
LLLGRGHAEFVLAVLELEKPRKGGWESQDVATI